jgi:glycyl-tRNA synthetase (class II)
MVDCRETKKRYRYDHILGRFVNRIGGNVPGIFVTTMETENTQAVLEDAALKF